MDRSPLLLGMLVDDSNDYRLWVNNIWYQQYYLWVDGIYPKYTCFVQTISNPDVGKQSNFSLGQESANKDVEGAFKVLQAHPRPKRHRVRLCSHEQHDSLR